MADNFQFAKLPEIAYWFLDDFIQTIYPNVFFAVHSFCRIFLQSVLSYDLFDVGIYQSRSLITWCTWTFNASLHLHEIWRRASDVFQRGTDRWHHGMQRCMLDRVGLLHAGFESAWITLKRVSDLAYYIDRSLCMFIRTQNHTDGSAQRA